MVTIRPKVFWIIFAVWGLITWCIVAIGIDRAWWHEKYNIDAGKELYSAYRQVLPTSQALDWSESSELYRSLQTFVWNNDANKYCFRGDLQRSEYNKLAAARGITVRDLPPMQWDADGIPKWMMVSIILSLACGVIYLSISFSIWAYQYLKRRITDERAILRRVLIAISIIGILAFYPLIIAWLVCVVYLIYALLTRKWPEKMNWLVRVVAIGSVLLIVVFYSAVQVNSRNKMCEAETKARHALRELDLWQRDAALNRLIYLSNRMYAVYVIETNTTTAQEKTKQLIEYEYFKKQVEEVITELKKWPKNDEDHRIIDPAVDICNGIVNFITLYTAYADSSRREMNQAKAIAEFRVVLDKLREYTDGELQYNRLSYPYQFGLLLPDAIKRFDPKAVEEYKKILADNGTNQYHIFPLFGYILYDYVEKNSAKPRLGKIMSFGRAAVE